MSSSAHSQEINSQIRRQSVSSATSDEDEEFIDDDDSNDRSITPADNNSNSQNKNKKTLGRVKIKMAYIDNKIRRYTTFSKRKTGIMKKAYELATLTGTEVMLLVASETGKIK
jgi:pheromone receptor transcription factor